MLKNSNPSRWRHWKTRTTWYQFSPNKNLCGWPLSQGTFRLQPQIIAEDLPLSPQKKAPGHSENGDEKSCVFLNMGPIRDVSSLGEMYPKMRCDIEISPQIENDMRSNECLLSHVFFSRLIRFHNFSMARETWDIHAMWCPLVLS